MDGTLLVDKPWGWTSHDVVAKVRSILRQSGVNKPKVGHTGTLDPMATGLLVLVVGSYTKRAGEFSKLDKTYEVTTKLGETSSTGDAEGEKTKINTRQPTKADLENVLEQFVGEIEQTPPAFSAIKVDGQRAYKLARAGKEVKLEPRKVKIYEITDVDCKYPEIRFTAKVSSGTYIRSLVEDIGQKLGTGAYMTALKRTEVGAFKVSDATAVNSLNTEIIHRAIRVLP